MEIKESKVKKEISLKVILLGDSAVGKSLLIKRFITNKIPDISVPTLGCDSFIKNFKLDDNYHFKLKIWDSAGQERFRALIRNYYKDVDITIFVYDITNKDSFYNIEFWINDYEEISSLNNPVILLGIAL